MRTWHIAALLALACGGEVESSPEAENECARFTPAEGYDTRFRYAGGAPSSCLSVPFGENEGTVQEVAIDPPQQDAFDVTFGPCSDLSCP